MPERSATHGLAGNQNFDYRPGFIAPGEADRYLERLTWECEWRRITLTLFGRRVAAPRLIAWYGDPGVAYGYSGQRHCAAGWTAALAVLREHLAQALGCRFNSVLANYYRDGNDSMGWHSDDEGELGARPLIASLSFGASRRFRMRRCDDHGVTQTLTLEHGSLLVMRGDSQGDWQHCLPKSRRVTSPRINLTFRQVAPAEEMDADSP